VPIKDPETAFDADFESGAYVAMSILGLDSSKPGRCNGGNWIERMTALPTGTKTGSYPEGGTAYVRTAHRHDGGGLSTEHQCRTS